MPWEGQAVDAEDVGINAGAENQVFVDWGSGSVPIPCASGGRIVRAGRPPFGLGGPALDLLFHKREGGMVLLLIHPLLFFCHY